MTRRTAGVLLAVCLLTGCTSDDRPEVPPERGAPAPTTAPPTTTADTAEAAYGGRSAQAPALSVVDAVDLSPAGEGPSAFASAVVPGPDGSAYVLVTAPDAEQPHRLATVGPVDGRLAVVRSVPVPRMRLIWDMHPLPDGTVAVAGWLQPGARGFGFTVVDPGSGAVRVIDAIPHEEGTVSAYGHSALSPDGRTLYLFVGTTVGYRSTDLLVALDARTGEFRAGRDLLDETRGRSVRSVGRFAAGLVPRPSGGVVLVFGSVPPADREVPVPTLLGYDADLSPVGYRLPGGVGAIGETVAVAAGGRGTIFVAVSSPGVEWLLAAAEGDGPTTRALELERRGFDYSFVVDPSETWMVLPGVDGVRAVDLASGEAATLGFGCGMGFPARSLTPGGDGTTALAVGECADGPERIPMLWAIGS